MIAVGDWVTIDLKDYKVTGYVLSINRESGMVRVMRTVRTFPSGSRVAARRPDISTYGISQCVPESINTGSWQAPIDIALSTRDKQWFYQIIKRSQANEQT